MTCLRSITTPFLLSSRAAFQVGARGGAVKKDVSAAFFRATSSLAVFPGIQPLAAREHQVLRGPSPSIASRFFHLSRCDLFFSFHTAAASGELHLMMQSYASTEIKLRTIRDFIRAGGNVNGIDSKGKTPLFYAVRHLLSAEDGYRILTALFNAGARINREEYEYSSPIIDVLVLPGFKNAKLGVLRALLEHGANLAWHDARNQNPYAFVIEAANLEFQADIMELFGEYDSCSGKY